MKFDYLNGTTYEIEQPEEMYHFNSDTEILGRFMRLKKTDVVLDIGTNTGALLLYAANQHPKALYGIDLFDQVIQVAKENMQHNHVEAHLQVCNVQEYKENKKFDVIVSNPPYFNTSNEELINENSYLSAARHEKYLSLDTLFLHCERLIAENGVLYLVHRCSRFNEILAIARKHGFYAQRMRIAYGSTEGKGKSVVLCFGRFEECHLQMDEPIYLNDRSTFAPTKGEGR